MFLNRFNFIALITFFAGPVLAQSVAPVNISMERFNPGLGAEPIIDANSAAVSEHLSWTIGTFLNYANDPLVLTQEVDGQTKRVESLLGHRLGLDLAGSVAFLGILEVGLDLPLVLYQGSGKTSDILNGVRGDLNSFGSGDLRIYPKIQLLRAERHWVDVALASGLSVPISSSRAFLGEGTFTVMPEVLVSRRFGDVRAAFNFGYKVRKARKILNLKVDDEFTYRLATGYQLQRYLRLPLEAMVSLSGSTGVKVPFRKLNRNPLELLAGAAYRVFPNLQTFLGMGFGLVAGYATPDFRIFAGLSLVSAKADAAPADSDGDGILDSQDNCPNEPEDKDDFEDADGCPDLDNDQDTIVDKDDKCPLEAENKNGFEDTDGCPEDIPDSDKDGIADTADLCPNDPEDVDLFEDGDGCPDLDNDQDSIEDKKDRCPLEFGLPENVGCPDKDRDGDGVVDRVDNCPDVAGLGEFDGCQAPQLVRLTAEKIDILEKVFFDTGKDIIQSQSFRLLDNIAAVLIAHPEIERVQVEGHTDSQGDAASNKDLSKRRAEAVVRYLVDKQVAAARLSAVGFGEERPISPNSTSKGRATNRRVEFVILGGAKGQEEPKGP